MYSARPLQQKLARLFLTTQGLLSEFGLVIVGKYQAKPNVVRAGPVPLESRASNIGHDNYPIRVDYLESGARKFQVADLIGCLADVLKNHVSISFRPVTKQVDGPVFNVFGG